jgi:methylmalonyl-CoA carboxyltransferase large subunit
VITEEDLTLTEAMEELRAEIARLDKRIEVLESQNAALKSGSTNGAQSAASLKAKELERLVFLISASIAAYLGVKPRIKRIRLVEGGSWAQQGRVTVQASHSLPINLG